jgi:hypothetical protein
MIFSSSQSGYNGRWCSLQEHLDLGLQVMTQAFLYLSASTVGLILPTAHRLSVWRERNNEHTVGREVGSPTNCSSLTSSWLVIPEEGATFLFLASCPGRSPVGWLGSHAYLLGQSLWSFGWGTMIG